MKHKIATVVTAVLILVLLFTLQTEGADRAWMIAGILLVYVAVTAWGSYKISANWFVESINNIDVDKILLTFDDGPDPLNTPVVLDILKKHDVKAMFFVIGSKAENHPDLLLRIQQEGHLIGNHSYFHEKRI